MSSGADREGWIGRALIDGDGRRLGTIDELRPGHPGWFVVRLGRFGRSRCLVPLHDARPTEDGVVTPHARSLIAAAPKAGLDGQLTEEQAIALYGHYGLPRDTAAEPQIDPPSPRDRVLGYLDIR